mmetsp:Transcript_27250/g.62543  ORF Transcript_27250/g.62543 Transcript_27250/m.62543 type:complete len:84 (-) Transcript_27250:52-303(-)
MTTDTLCYIKFVDCVEEKGLIVSSSLIRIPSIPIAPLVGRSPNDPWLGARSKITVRTSVWTREILWTNVEEAALIIIYKPLSL